LVKSINYESPGECFVCDVMPPSLVNIYGFFGRTGDLQLQSRRLSKHEFEILTDLNYKKKAHNQIYKLTSTEMAKSTLDSVRIA
jgi:hypothetical protein